jgi:hypothetical protein
MPAHDGAHSLTRLSVVFSKWSCAAANVGFAAPEGNQVNRFITRVELNGAVWPTDYDKLHAFMAEALFRRTITADDGREYHLPSAMYFSFGDLPAEDVRTLAMRAANRTGCDAVVLVCQAEKMVWSLKPVAATPPPVSVYPHLESLLHTLLPT